MRKNNKYLKMAVAAAMVTPVIVATVPNFAEANTTHFSDVDSSHWAYNAIQQSVEQKIITGYTDGTFKPKNNVTRSEFAAILSRAINSDERVGEEFTDIKETHWAKDYIEKGIALGFIDPSDYPNNKFEPEKTMTRIEIAKWLTKGLMSSNSEYGKLADEMKNSNRTLLPVTEYLKGGIPKNDVGFVGVMIGTGLMVGSNHGDFNPYSNATRAEMVTIIQRFLKAIEQEPTSFADLNELLEVARTGTNIFSTTGYKYGKNFTDGFEKILGKPVQYSNGMGVATIERVIFVDRVNNVGIYKNMFRDTIDYVTKDVYEVYKEHTFTPNYDVNMDDWLRGTGLPFYQSGSSNLNIAKKYNYRTFAMNDKIYKNHFLKTGVKNVFWGFGFVYSASGSELWGSLGNGNRYLYKHE